MFIKVPLLLFSEIQFSSGACKFGIAQDRFILMLMNAADEANE